MLRKKVKLLLEHLQVCIFAEIVFGVRCTLTLQKGTEGFTELKFLLSNSSRSVLFSIHGLFLFFASSRGKIKVHMTASSD